MEEQEYVETNDYPAVIFIPRETVDMTVTLRLYKDGQITSVHGRFDLDEIREMFRMAEDHDYDDDIKYVITDKGREYMEELLRERNLENNADAHNIHSDELLRS